MGLHCAGESLLVEGVSEGLLGACPLQASPLRTQPIQCSFPEDGVFLSVLQN